MTLIDADKFLAYLIYSKHIDELTCGKVKEAVEMCKVDVLDKIKTEIEFKSSKYTLIKDDGAINIPNKIEWSSDKLIKESEVINIINKYKGE